MNPFESGARKLIPAVLVYVKSVDGQVLMIHRNSKKNDYHHGKCNGLGGKLEPNESALEAARRELKEESGLDLPAGCFAPLGFVHFPNFKPVKSEDWIVSMWVAQLSCRASEVTTIPCNEGSLEWVKESDMLTLNLWEGDRFFIPYIIKEQPFQGTIWYEGEKVARHQILPLI
jgi:8-oxo-dGTP diphosphatase